MQAYEPLQGIQYYLKKILKRKNVLSKIKSIY